jgi:hypothetical protein
MAFRDWAAHMLQWLLQKEAIVAKLKNNLSSDYNLKLGYMKVESLVIVY